MPAIDPRPATRGLALALLAVLALAGTAGADQDVHEMPITAHGEASSCVQDTSPCLAVETTTGLIEDDDRLDLSFANNGSQPHSLLIAPGSEADPENGTPAKAAFAELGPIDPGETVEVSVEVPGGTDTLHTFCDVGDHEEQGMHLSRNVHPGGSVQKAENETIGPPGDQGRIPLGLTAGIAALGLASVAARRRT